MAHKVIKKTKRAALSLRIRIIGVLGLFGLGCLVLTLFIHKVEEQKEFVSIHMILTKINGIISKSFEIDVSLIVLIILILISRKIYTKKTNVPYFYLLYFQLDKWLQDVDLCLIHGDDLVIIPKVRKYKDKNNFGLEIQILGNLREKMLKINSSLSSYLSSKGIECFVTESYEVSGGYIRYIFSEGILLD